MTELKQKRILDIEPDCFKLMTEKEVVNLLDLGKRVITDSLNASVLLEKMDEELSANDLEREVDYDELIDLEDYLNEVELNTIDYDRDDNGFVNAFIKGIMYYNKACAILGRDTCCNSVRDCIQMKRYLSVALGNLGSSFTSAFWDLIRYYDYQTMIERDEKSLAMETYPDLSEDTQLNVCKILEGWFHSIRMEYKEFCKLIMSVSGKYAVTSELPLIYKDKFSQFREALKDYGYEDIISETMYEYVLIQDIDCILEESIKVDDDYVNRLQKRAGLEEGTAEYTSDELSLLHQIYLIAPEDHKFLYDYEFYILDNPDWCDRAQQNGSITPLMKKEILNNVRDNRKLDVDTDFFK